MSIFQSRLKYVTCKTWDTVSNPGFPELDDQELSVDHIKGRPGIGVAFSGGGTRSASATLGQLRALSHLGLLEDVKYISCVSGGSWACVPFSFLPKNKSDKTFLGPIVDPHDLNLERLGHLDTGGFSHAISNSFILDNLIKNAFAGDEIYSRAIGDIFLNPFGLDSLRRFFTQDEKSLKVILSNNLKMDADDFYLMHPNRPFLIVGATLLRTPFLSFRARKYQVEITPLYTGIYNDHGPVGSRDQRIGGGYLEPFGFDSEVDPNDKADAKGYLEVKLGGKRHRFTLSDMVGTSGSAPAEIFDELKLDFLGLPEFRYWPVAEAQAGKTNHKEYEYADGGVLENLGIMPLLLRKVKKIVAFVNTKRPLISARSINKSISNLFGQDPGFTLNHVFPESEYEKLVDGLLGKKRANETVLHQATHKVLKNSHYGIQDGDVEVLWVYNEIVKKWENKLPQAVQDLIGHGELSNFPHYRTFGQNLPKVIDLSARQVSLLAHLSCWNILENEGSFRKMLT